MLRARCRSAPRSRAISASIVRKPVTKAGGSSVKRKPAAQRQPAEPHGEAELQQQPEEEARHRDRAERHDARQVVGPAVAIDRRHQAGRNADRDGEQHGREDEFQRRRKVDARSSDDGSPRVDRTCPSRRAEGRSHSASTARRAAGRGRTPCHRRRSRPASRWDPRRARPDRPAAAARSRRRASSGRRAPATSRGCVCRRMKASMRALRVLRPARRLADPAATGISSLQRQREQLHRVRRHRA